MSDREREDLLVERAIEELRRLPDVPAGVPARVASVALAAGARDEVDAQPPREPRRWMRISLYLGLAAAAGIVGFVLRGALQPAHDAAPRVTPSAAPLLPVADAAADADARALPRQFAFRSRTAHRVAVVGDFNGWNPRATPLERTPGSGLWSATIAITPGRHSYAFMVDDSLYRLDPRAPTVKDPDLGTSASVIVVGRP